MSYTQAPAAQRGVTTRSSSGPKVRVVVSGDATAGFVPQLAGVVGPTGVGARFSQRSPSGP